jgi:hypothetical protein
VNDGPADPASARAGARHITAAVLLLVALLAVYDLYPMLTLAQRQRRFETIASIGARWNDVERKLKAEHYTILSKSPERAIVLFRARRSYLMKGFLAASGHLLSPEHMKNLVERHMVRGFGGVDIDTSGTIVSVF